MEFVDNMAQNIDQIENLQLRLESEICGLSVEALSKFAQHVEVNVEGLRKIQISKKVREKIESKLEVSEDKKALLEGYFDQVNPEPPPLEVEDNEVATSSETNNEAQVKKSNTEPASKDPASKINVDLARALKRDFKIFGIVGGDRQKDCLSFVSLSRQVDAGVKAGYHESEIVEAVIRAVSPSQKLRSYLEMMDNLSLIRLKQILRAHFKEKTGTELYQELTSLCQSPKESVQDFLMRAMNLREQVIFASQKEDSVVKYDKYQVQSLFVHVVETGIQQESVRAKLRPYLEKPGITDEELMERVNVAVSAEMERHNKLASGAKKSAQVSQIGSHIDISEQDCSGIGDTPLGKKKDSKSKKNLNENGQISATLKSVQADLASLKEAFQKSQSNQSDTPKNHWQNQRQQRKHLCDSCKSSGKQVCDHCFKCGSSEHFARGCKTLQGNGRRLQPGDRG